jgi:hypothetical protein
VPETTQDQAPADPAERAYAELHAGVYQPEFFRKLAELTLVPRDDREALQLLAIGERLTALHEEEAVKEAAAGGSLLDFAVSRLDQLTGAADPDRAVKAAGAQLTARHPQYLDAAAALLAAAAAR